MLRHFFIISIDCSAWHCGDEIVIGDLWFVFPLLRGNASDQLGYLVGCLCAYLLLGAGVVLCLKLV